MSNILNGRCQKCVVCETCRTCNVCSSKCDGKCRKYDKSKKSKKSKHHRHHRDHHCERGERGPRGYDGCDGKDGATGASGISNFANIYHVGDYTVPINEDIPFNTNGIISSGFSHTVPDKAITIVNAGVYIVFFYTTSVEPNQFALFQNGLAPYIPGGLFGSGSGTQQNNGAVIINAMAGDTLTLRNHSSPAAVGLANLSGGTEINVNASLTIIKLA
jgi:hypothetical protein